MNATASVSRDPHQVILCGLEVLRLMGERVASRQDVDAEDIQVVLGFMRDVAHRCLDNAQLETVRTNHAQARTLFAQLTHAADPINTDEFCSICAMYTNLLANLIFEEGRVLTDLAFAGPALQEMRAAAWRHGQVLHRLETKYTSPHCI